VLIKMRDELPAHIVIISMKTMLHDEAIHEEVLIATVGYHLI
jgi:hypothetical protein